MREKRLFYNPFGYRMDFFVEPEFLLAKKNRKFAIDNEIKR